MEILQDAEWEVLTLEDFPYLPEVIEDGETFADNAVKKAVAVAEATGELSLADDSGLEVDFLGGKPGVYSARFAGEPCDDHENNKKLLELLQGVPDEDRTARFRCVIAVAHPRGEVRLAEGVCEGKIAFYPRGEGGFGYDPLFIPTGYDKTFAEISPEEKNSISHRGKALQKARSILDEWLKEKKI